MADLLITTNPGLEDVVEAELRCHARSANVGARLSFEPRPDGYVGRVLVRASLAPERLEGYARRLRSAHHLIRPITSSFLPDRDPVAHLAALASDLPFAELRNARSFRVTCRRVGAHGFGSPDVERAVGSALLERFRVPVNLGDPEVDVCLDIHDRLCSIGVQLTREPLSRRFVRRSNPRTALKTNVAYACLFLALEGHSDGDSASSVHAEAAPVRILDPFCGSGTIAYEAATAWPRVQVVASDRSQKAVHNARANLADRGCAHVEVREVDARFASDAYPARSFDAIVTNPPYGSRLGGSLDFDRFYHRVLTELGGLLVPGAPLVLLAERRRELLRAAGRTGLHLVHERRVDLGRLSPGLFLFRG